MRSKIQLIREGITKVKADVIVSTANSSLLDGVLMMAYTEQVLSVSFTDEDHSILLEKAKEK